MRVTKFDSLFLIPDIYTDYEYNNEQIPKKILTVCWLCFMVEIL